MSFFAQSVMVFQQRLAGRLSGKNNIRRKRKRTNAVFGKQRGIIYIKAKASVRNPSIVNIYHVRVVAYFVPFHLFQTAKFFAG
jgi:hypothetical protein